MQTLPACRSSLRREVARASKTGREKVASSKRNNLVAMFLAGDGSVCYFYNASERAELAAYHGQLFSWDVPHRATCGEIPRGALDAQVPPATFFSTCFPPRHFGLSGCCLFAPRLLSAASRVC